MNIYTLHLFQITLCANIHAKCSIINKWPYPWSKCPIYVEQISHQEIAMSYFDLVWQIYYPLLHKGCLFGNKCHEDTVSWRPFQHYWASLRRNCSQIWKGHQVDCLGHHWRHYNWISVSSYIWNVINIFAPWSLTKWKVMMVILLQF